MAEKWNKRASQAAEAFASWRDEHGLTDEDVGALLDCSTSVASQMLRQVYDGNVAKYADRMRSILRDERLRAEGPAEARYVRTQVARQVEAACTDARLDSDLVYVVGATGVGKTMAARHYAEEIEPQSLYVYTGPQCGASSLVRLLADELHVSHEQRAVYDVRREVEARLARGVRVLIVDEIDYPSESLLQCVRAIYDQAGIGVVAIGTFACLRKLRASRSDTKAQIVGRIGSTVTIPRCGEADLRHIALQWGLDNETLDALIDVAAGQARHLVKVWRRAVRLDGGDVTPSVVARAAAQLLDPREYM